MIKRILNPNQILSLLFYTTVFLFFATIYKYHLYFKEQQQLFLLTAEYFVNTVKVPGGFLNYIGEFLTQFYYWPIAGAVIITFLIFIMQSATTKILNKIKKNPNLFPLSFLPAMFYGVLLCNDFYYLAGLVGFCISLWISVLYYNLNNRTIRFVFGIILIPMLSYLIGGAYLLFVVLISIFETIQIIKNGSKKINLLIIIIYLLIAVVFPLLLRQYFTITILQAFLTGAYYKLEVVLPFSLVLLVLSYPSLMLIYRYVTIQSTEKRKGLLIFSIQSVIIYTIGGIILFKSSFWGASNFVAYDNFARKGEWSEIIEMAKKENPQDQLSLVYLNLALSKTGQLGNQLFQFRQTGTNGLVLNDNNNNYEPFLVGNELYYHLGLVNVAQYFAFEGMETTPDHKKNVRCIKRLAETNLINSQYNVALKYLKLLDNTLFYSNWAKEKMLYLKNENKINKDPEYGLMRNLKPRSQYFFTYDQVDVILRICMKDNPKNIRAFEYLMTYYLLNKDLKSFKSYYSLGKEALTSNVPKSFQEAVIYIISHQVDQLNSSTIPGFVTADVVNRLNQYANIFTSYPNPKDLLEKNFKDTFWFYFQYR
ncbi:MAG: DUF6057 family protein [Bacteroidales bacterium]